MKLLPVFLITLFLAATVTAQSIRVGSGFTDDIVSLDQPLEFQVVAIVEVSADKGEPKMAEPKLPKIKGLTFEYLGGEFVRTGQQMTWDGQRRSVTLTYQGRYRWKVTASKVGRYQVPGITIDVNGVSKKTDPAVLRVEKDAPGNRYVGATVVVSTPTPYVNQPIKLRYVLSMSRVPVQTRTSIPRLTIPWAGSPNGFKAMPLKEVDRRRQALAVKLNDGDQSYLQANVKGGRDTINVEVELDKTLIPIAPGKIDIGGTVASLEVAKEARERGMLRGTEYIGRTRAFVKTEPIILEVRDAPTVGRPENYRGVLGDFDVEVSYGEGEIRAGDGVTLNIVFKGGEVLTLIEEPKIDESFPECRVLPSGRVLEGEGDKRTLTFSWLIKPLRDDLKELPKFEYGWFRPSGEYFDVAVAEALPLTITGKMEEDSVFIGTGKTSEQIKVEALGEGVRALKDAPGSIKKRIQSTSLTIFFVLLLLPVVSLGFCSVALKKKRALASDQSLSRRKRASKEAEARLAEAKALLGQQGFHGKLSRSLAGFVADKIGVPPASVSAATAKSLLEPRGLSSDRIAEITKSLNDLDMQAFSGATGTEAEQRGILDGVENLIHVLDKELKK